MQQTRSERKRERQTRVYDTDSGLGGVHTVTLVEDHGDGTATASVCYGTFRDTHSPWEFWDDWDGALIPVRLDQLRNGGRLGEPAKARRQRGECYQ